MKKLLGIVVLGILLSSCGSARINYYNHYSDCTLKNKSFIDSAKCASKQRYDHLIETGLSPREENDLFESYVNLLADKVSKNQISEAEAKHLVVQEHNRRKAEARAALDRMIIGIGKEFDRTNKKNSDQELKTY